MCWCQKSFNSAQIPRRVNLLFENKLIHNWFHLLKPVHNRHLKLGHTISNFLFALVLILKDKKICSVNWIFILLQHMNVMLTVKYSDAFQKASSVQLLHRRTIKQKRFILSIRMLSEKDWSENQKKISKRNLIKNLYKVSSILQLIHHTIIIHIHIKPTLQIIFCTITRTVLSGAASLQSTGVYSQTTAIQ